MSQLHLSFPKGFAHLVLCYLCKCCRFELAVAASRQKHCSW